MILAEKLQLCVRIPRVIKEHREEFSLTLIGPPLNKSFCLGTHLAILFSENWPPSLHLLIPLFLCSLNDATDGCPLFLGSVLK